MPEGIKYTFFAFPIFNFSKTCLFLFSDSSVSWAFVSCLNLFNSLEEYDDCDH